MPCRKHFSESGMQRSITSNEKVSYLYFGVLPENKWMSFLHSTSHYSLRKSLKDLSDHLNFFVSCQGRSQLSLAIFRASRNHLVASKQSYMLKLSKSGIVTRSVKANLTYDLMYIEGIHHCTLQQTEILWTWPGDCSMQTVPWTFRITRTEPLSLWQLSVQILKLFTCCSTVAPT